jgi:uncharacterized protein
MTRDSREEPTALVPGKRYQVKVRLNGVAFSFPQGHRLMVAISNATGLSSGHLPDSQP